MASSRFKWTDLIVVPVGLMAPLIGIYLQFLPLGLELFAEHHLPQGVIVTTVSIIVAIIECIIIFLVFGGVLFASFKIIEWFFSEKWSEGLRYFLVITLAVICLYLWVRYLNCG
jgi:hypothetical protein